jgi:hypothetical protein
LRWISGRIPAVHEAIEGNIQEVMFDVQFSILAGDRELKIESKKNG